MNMTDLILQMAMSHVQQPVGGQGTANRPSHQMERPEKSDFQSLLEEKHQAATAKPGSGPTEQEMEEEAAPIVSEEIQAMARAMSEVGMAPPLQLVPVEEILGQANPGIEHVGEQNSVLQPLMNQPASYENSFAEPTLLQLLGMHQAGEPAPAAECAVQQMGTQETAAELMPEGAVPTAAESEAGQSSMEAQSGAASPRQDDLPEAEVTEGAAPVEQPLFRETEPMPVKVGEAATLDASSETFEKDAAKTIADAMEQGVQKVELKLTPEHLGTVTVELTRSADGALRVVLLAESQQTMKLLNDRSAQLGMLLQNNNQGDVRVEVPGAQESQQHWQQPDQNPEGRQQQNQNPRRQEEHSGEDFLHQLRLGLFQMEEAV